MPKVEIIWTVQVGELIVAIGTLAYIALTYFMLRVMRQANQLQVALTDLVPIDAKVDVPELNGIRVSLHNMSNKTFAHELTIWILASLAVPLEELDSFVETHIAERHRFKAERIFRRSNIAGEVMATFRRQFVHPRLDADDKVAFVWKALTREPFFRSPFIVSVLIEFSSPRGRRYGYEFSFHNGHAAFRLDSFASSMTETKPILHTYSFPHSVLQRLGTRHWLPLRFRRKIALWPLERGLLSRFTRIPAWLKQTGFSETAEFSIDWEWSETYQRSLNEDE